jgi:uncharacterized coiled-coil protein SlyX
VTEAPDRESQGDKPPEAAPQVASSRAPVIAVSLAAMVVLGAAAANSLPGFAGLPLLDFKQISLPSIDRFSLPDFSRFSPPKFNHVAASPPPKPAPILVPAPVLVPDPVVRAGLRDIQSSQQQNGEVLESLTQGSATQQAELKRITRQLALLTAQVSSLQNSVTAPLTTSSIAPSITSSIPHPNPRARVVHASRKVVPPVLSPTPPATLPPLPKPVGPFSVGGAPLSPPPAAGSGAS